MLVYLQKIWFVHAYIHACALFDMHVHIKAYIYVIWTKVDASLIWAHVVASILLYCQSFS